MCIQGFQKISSLSLIGSGVFTFLTTALLECFHSYLKPNLGIHLNLGTLLQLAGYSLFQLFGFYNPITIQSLCSLKKCLIFNFTFNNSEWKPVASSNESLSMNVLFNMSAISVVISTQHFLHIAILPGAQSALKRDNVY